MTNTPEREEDRLPSEQYIQDAEEIALDTLYSSLSESVSLLKLSQLNTNDPESLHRYIDEQEEILKILDDKKRYSYRISALLLGKFLREHVYKQPKELYEMRSSLARTMSHFEAHIRNLVRAQEQITTLQSMLSSAENPKEYNQCQEVLMVIDSQIEQGRVIIERAKNLSNELESALAPIQFKPVWSKEVWEEEFRRNS